MLTNIQKLYVYNFLHSFVLFGAIGVPFFLDWAHLNYKQIFLLQIWFTFWIFVLEVPTGAIADTFGRKLSLLLSGAFTALGVLSYAIIPNFYLFMLAELVFAIGMAFKSGADKALLYDSLNRSQKKNSGAFFSHYMLAGNLGFIVAMPLGSLLAGASIFNYPESLRIAMLLTSIPIFTSFLFAFSFKEVRRKSHTESLIKQGFKGTTYLLKHRALRSFAIDNILVSATTFFIFWFYQPIAINAGIPIWFLGFIAAGFNILAVIALYNLKYLEKAIPTRRLLFLTALIPAITFASLVFVSSWLLIVTAILITATAQVLRQPLFDHFMNKHIPSKDRATVLSAQSMLQRMMIGILYPIVGFLADISVYHAIGLLAFLTFIFAFFARVDEAHLQTGELRS
ncbi:MFS transporter [Candidatus Woesearchaeota archaeon]|nr:MFS transporter [Candidatus Woesearchaeota archaeon]